MDPAVLPYLGFIVAALILIWAVVELSNRYTRQKKSSTKEIATWIQLDSTPIVELEEDKPEEDIEDQDEKPEVSIHTRAQQNGHYTGSKKPL